MLVPLTGGTPRPCLGAGDATPSWSADGTRLARFNSTAGDVLFVADRTGGDARRIELTVADPGEWSGDAERVHNHNPAWSPDDQWLYFVHGSLQQLNWTEDRPVARSALGRIA